MTDTRGQQPPYQQTYGTEQPKPAAQPYHPPQAYPAPAPASAPQPGAGAGTGAGAGAQVGTQQGQGQSQTQGQGQIFGQGQGQQGVSVTTAASGTAAATAAVRLPRTGARTTPRTRKARLRVSKADPWSVMKVSFLLSIALGVCTVVAAAVLWMVMDAMGVFSTVGGTISEATGSTESNGFDLQSFLSLPRVLIFTSVIAVIDVVLATALATLGAFIYNLSAGFVGGVELTLAEDE
ncbi:DUF3566 domain-containing protein [Streptomyces paludis]|uniref:DUF3566 domain-containing protein n=1 Tax=Streptomyces paludis TaxID=2282738 RepID=UPI001E5027C6|nr:DUF3566 domain-containing protein [Streptomyces paludis]